MLLGGAARVDVVAAIGVTVDDVPARIQRLLHALRPAVLQDAR
jgi:hypothetical protein